MANLLKETSEFLSERGKSADDVHWVQSRTSDGKEISFSWMQFVALANFDYDDGYGCTEVNQSLKVVGADWWLERGEYDGSEWWEFKTMPICPAPETPRPSDLKDR